MLAALAGVCAVLAAWDLAAGLDRVRLLAAIGRTLAPARAAGRDGRDASGAEARRLAVVTMLVAGVTGALLSGPPGAIAAALLAPSAAGLIVRTRRRRWRRRLNAGAPAALLALADALAAGHGIPGAIATAGRDGAVRREVCDALDAVSGAIAMGAPVAGALASLRDHAGPGTWDVAVAALLLQREAGGDLVALLRGLAADADRMAADAADARAASAQARLTARIVLGLPALACALLVLASPSSALAMVREPLPLALLTAAGLLQTLALLAVWRIAGDRGR